MQRIVQSFPRRCLHQQQRTITSNLRIATAAPSPSESQEEYTFTHARSKDMFDRMTKLDLEEIKALTELINEKLGITISDAERRGFRGGGGISGNSGGEEVEEEIVVKTAFDLKLTGFDPKKKIKVIKEVRAMTGLGLKEAKDMVEGAPKTIKNDIKMEEAEELKAKLEAVGATIEIS